MASAKKKLIYFDVQCEEKTYRFLVLDVMVGYSYTVSEAPRVSLKSKVPGHPVKEKMRTKVLNRARGRKDARSYAEAYLRERVITVDTYVIIKITSGRRNMKNRLKLVYSCSCQASV